MCVDGEVEPLRKSLDRPLEVVVLELRHGAAAVADDVVVVLPTRKRRLVASHARADVEPLDEPQLVEQLERAVDARLADAATVEAVGQLPGGDAAAFARHRLDDRAARGARAVARALECGERVGAPVRFRLDCHDEPR